MVEPADLQAYDGVFIVVLPAHAIVMPQQVADSAAPGAARRGKRTQLLRARRLQDEAGLMLPGILGLPGKPELPLRRVAVWKRADVRHLKAVVKQADDPR